MRWALNNNHINGMVSRKPPVPYLVIWRHRERSPAFANALNVISPQFAPPVNNKRTSCKTHRRLSTVLFTLMCTYICMYIYYIYTSVSYIFWDIKTCNPLKVHRILGGKFCLHLQRRCDIFLRNASSLSTDCTAL
jgi:hypothetical protein